MEQNGSRLPIVRGDGAVEGTAQEFPGRGGNDGRGFAATAQERVNRLGQQVGPAARRADELVGASARQTAQGLRAAADVLETRSWGRWVPGAIAVLLIIAAFYVLGGNNAPSWVPVPYESVSSALDRSGGWWMGPVVSGERISMTEYRFSHWENGPVFTNAVGEEVEAVQQIKDTGAVRWHLEETPYYFLRDARGVTYIASDPNAW